MRTVEDIVRILWVEVAMKMIEAYKSDGNDDEIMDVYRQGKADMLATVKKLQALGIIESSEDNE